LTKRLLAVFLDERGSTRRPIGNERALRFVCHSVACYTAPQGRALLSAATRRRTQKISEASPFPGVDTNPLIFFIRKAKPKTTFFWAKCHEPQTASLKQ